MGCHYKIALWLLFAFLAYALCGCCWSRTYYESGQTKETKIEVKSPVQMNNVSGLTITVN